MPDLERELRELLTDDRLDVPMRSDATHVIRSGVRRRRRNRAIAVSAAAMLAAGAAVTAALTVPAAVSGHGHSAPVPATPSYDVKWVDKPAPRLWAPKPIQPKPPSMDAPRCLASQLHVVHVDTNGATGMLFHYIRLRNVSSSPCLLVGTPQRVAAQQPGQPDVVATRGLHLGSGGEGGDLQPGKLGYLTIETDRDCPARYADPNNTFPTKTYSSLSVTLPSGTSFTVPVTLDVFCGLHTGGLGIQVPEPTQPPDPRADLVPSLDAPDHATAGQTLHYVVTLTNPTSTAISLHHCPGYVETLGASGAGLAKASLGLNCSTVHSIAPGQSVSYEMRLDIPADATWPNPVQLVWALEAGLAPQQTHHASATLTLRSP